MLCCLTLDSFVLHCASLKSISCFVRQFSLAFSRSSQTCPPAGLPFVQKSNRWRSVHFPSAYGWTNFNFILFTFCLSRAFQKLRQTLLKQEEKETDNVCCRGHHMHWTKRRELLYELMHTCLKYALWRFHADLNF